MKKVKQLNNYDICSGGYIADVMDRTAQEHLIKNEPFYLYWLTAGAKIKFLRQSNSRTPTYTVISYKVSFFRPNRASVKVVLWESLIGEPIAVGRFRFVGKNRLAVKPIKRG